MKKYKIDNILKKAEMFQKMAENTSEIFFRAQPIGKDLFNHTSKLAYEKVPGVFAYKDPRKIFETYSWIFMKKKIDEYEMIKFMGTLIDSPDDSEGLVVKPERILEKIPLKDFAIKYLPINTTSPII